MRKFNRPINDYSIANTRNKSQSLVTRGQNVLNLIRGHALFASHYVAKSCSIGTVEEYLTPNSQAINVCEGSWNLRGFAKAQHVPPQNDILTLTRFSAVDVPADIVIGHNRHILRVKPYRYQGSVEFYFWNDQPNGCAVAYR
jgi:hypothetical protein